jgi:hypothetical protein
VSGTGVQRFDPKADEHLTRYDAKKAADAYVGTVIDEERAENLGFTFTMAGAGWMLSAFPMTTPWFSDAAKD